MDAPITQFIVDAPDAALMSEEPQQFFPAPSPAAVYVSVPQGPGRSRSSRSNLVTALMIVLLVIAILYLVMRCRGLGSALASRGWVLYTSPGCMFCEKQMAALRADKYPKHVVCVGGVAHGSGTMHDAQGPLTCKGISAFPFWANEETGATRTGLQNRKQLRKMVRSPGLPGS